MDKVLALLEKRQEAKARDLFNRDIFHKYKDIKGFDFDNPLSRFVFFFYILDEFLNNSSARILGVSIMEDVVGSYYSDFQEDVKEALRQEKLLCDKKE